MVRRWTAWMAVAILVITLGPPSGAQIAADQDGSGPSHERTHEATDVEPWVLLPSLCTEVIGFSQTASWYIGGGFEDHVDPDRWQLRWRSGAAINFWSDPDYIGWDDDHLHHHCSTDTVDRVVLTISGNSSPDADRWAERIEAAVKTVREKHPGARILLQPVVGGVDHKHCYFTPPDGTPRLVRASFNAPVIAQATEIVAHDHLDVGVGAWPMVGECDLDGTGPDAGHFSDGLGHLTNDGKRYVAPRIAEKYTASPAGLFD